ncbi:MAG: hypothetical protein ACYS0I_01195 [Planctomycetota bacterium]|jgi:hypothetical protein
MQKAVLIDTSPKVFFTGVKSIRSISEPNNIIKYGIELVVQNCGKTEALNIKFPFVVNSREKKISEGTKGPFQYIFPGQTIRYGIYFVDTEFKLETGDISQLKKAIKADKPFHLGKESPSLRIDIEIAYEDIEGKKISTPYSFRYSWRRNMWFFSEMAFDF